VKAEDLAPLLGTVAHVAEGAGVVLPEPAGEVARILGAALRLAADIAAAGRSPAEEIQRIHAHDDALKDVESAWRELLRRRFGDPPPRP